MSLSGMDVDAVEALSKKLNGFADRLSEITNGLARDVGNLGSFWRGPDAQQFITTWATHKASLQSAHNSIRDLGHAAARNVQDQRTASQAGTTTASSGAVASSTPAAPTATADSGAPGKAGQTEPGQLPPGDENAYHAFEAKSRYNASVGYNVDANGAAQDNCTAWAQWRRDELGLSSPGGNGGQMAGNAGGTTDTPPSLGALVSYTEGAYGHVQVIEQIYPDGSFRVSEANFNGSSAVRSVERWYPQENGTWKNDRGQTRDLVIAP